MSNFSQQDWLTQVSKGEIPNHESVLIRGTNGDVGTSFETIWPESNIYLFPTTDSTMTLSSDDANDTALGTGARVVIVEGLDINYNEIIEEVTLNGTSGVSTVNSYFRVNRLLLKPNGAGSSGFNEGIIYIGTGVITSGKPAVVVNLIPINSSISQSGFYTVPSGKSLLSYTRTYGVDTGKSAVVVGTIVDQGVKYSVSTVPIIENTYQIDDEPPFLVGEKQDIIFTSISTSGGGVSSSVSVRVTNVLYTPL